MAPLTDSMQSFSLRCLSPHSLVEQRKCQIIIINPVLLARNYHHSAKQWNTKPVLHIFKLTVTTFSWETNEGGHPKTKSLIFIGKQLLSCKLTVTSSVEFLLSNEYCNCEVGNGWCEIHGKTTHSVGWRMQQKCVLFSRFLWFTLINQWEWSSKNIIVSQGWNEH